MENPNSIFIVKGRIRKYNYSGNEKHLRLGSPHFLPLEEIALVDDRHMRELVFLENRIKVRGEHRSSFFKTQRTNIRFLEQLKIHEIKKPTEGIINFINRTKILSFEKDSQKHNETIKLLKYIEAKEFPDIKGGIINDELYLAAKDYVFNLQKIIREKEFDKLISNFIKYPLVNKKWDSQRKMGEILNEEMLRINFDEIFTSETIEKIMSTDLKTIYPSPTNMVIGSLKISISRKKEFKISAVESIEKLKTYEKII